jgi:hypothetical protein
MTWGRDTVDEPDGADQSRDLVVRQGMKFDREAAPTGLPRPGTAGSPFRIR